MVMGNIDVVRPLGLAGIPCAAFAPPDDPVHWSRHVSGRVPWANPWEAPEAAADGVESFAREQDEPPVLFPQSDGDLLLVSRHRERLAEHSRFLLADAEVVEVLADKVRFSELAERLDLPVPRARLLRPAVEAAADVDLRFPLVIKPATRWGAKWAPIGRAAKARHVSSAAELATLWSQLAAMDLHILAQEAVPGPEALIESHHAYVDADGRVAGEFTGRKIRTRPAQYGHSTALVITDEPEVATLGREVLERVGLRGMAKADFKRDPDGRLRLLEINPRSTLWHHPAARAGVNLPALMYADLIGRTRPPVGRAQAGVRWCLPLRDAQAARDEGIPLRAWARWAAGCEAVSGLAWDDPLPFLGGVVAPALRRRARRIAAR